MEIELVIKNENIDEDLSREADSLRLEILRRFPNSVWEKCGEGHKIFV